MAKDWTGSKISTMKTLGASNHCIDDRDEHDFYATHSSMVDELIRYENFNKHILEPACGQGHISKVFENAGHIVTSTDLIDRGYGVGGIDFLKRTEKFDGDIVTNPPYKFGLEFVQKSLELIDDGSKVAMFLKLQFLETKTRRRLFDKHPPKTVYISSTRVECGKNGVFSRDDGQGGAVAYCWFVWVKGFNGAPQIKWFN